MSLSAPPISCPSARRRQFAVGCASLLAALACAAPPDPVEGRWLGTLPGQGGNVSDFGLEIGRDAAGKLTAGLYLEQMNYFADRAPIGAVESADGKYRIAGFGLEMTLAGDTLSGTQGRAQRPFSLRRVERLPEEKWPELPRGPEPKWERKLAGRIWAHVAVRDGVAYVGSDAGVFSAVKIADGTFAWNFPAGRPIYGEALVTDDAVLFVCDNGFLFKLARADGQEVWRYDLGDAQVSRILGHPAVYDYDHHAPKPVLADGIVYVGSGDGGFHAVNLADGRRVWRHQAKGKIRTTAALAGAGVIYGTLDGEAAALDRATGQPLWKLDQLGALTSAPALFGDRLLLGSRSSVLRALKLETRTELWRHHLWGSWVEATPVLADDGLGYLGTSDYRRVTCFDPADGRVVWRTDVFGTPWGRPAFTEKFVYVAAGGVTPYFIRHEGGLVALDRRTGRIVWRRPMPYPDGVFEWGYAAGPVLAGDVLVIGGLNGSLSAFPAE